jgi:hypothetical protein
MYIRDTPSIKADIEKNEKKKTIAKSTAKSKNKAPAKSSRR